MVLHIMQKISRLLPFIIIVLILSGCGGCNSSKSREKPDVSNIPVDIHLQRFDKDFSEFGTKDYAQHVEYMRNKYGPFFDFYVSQFVIGPRPTGETTNVNEAATKKFVSDHYIRQLQDSINYHFPDTKDLDKDITQSVKYFKYYFPKITIPKAVAINSGLGLGAFTYDKDVLGIGLDLYLGANNPDYDSAGIFKYLQHKMRREYITRNAMEVLYNMYFGQEDMVRGKTLAEAMVDKGKKIYCLSYLLPDAPDSMLVGFTEKQTRWCEANEYEIWKFLNDKDMLYKDNYMDQKRYLDEGPSTPGMPAEAPGNIGSWIGLQIVRKFMKDSGSKIPLQDFVIKYDAKTILAKAKYRPSKPVF
jgi:hypothetical protein